MAVCSKHGPLFGASRCPVKGCRGGSSAVALKLPGLDGGLQQRTLPCPLEDVEQELFIGLCRRFSGRFPDLDFVFAIPNGAWTTRAYAWKLVRTGLRKGVSDIFVPVPRRQWRGMWIELKRLRGDGPTIEQLAWLDAMQAFGYRAEWYRGGWAAWRGLCAYLEIPLDDQGLPRGD